MQRPVIALLICLATAAIASAQDAILERQETDAIVRIELGTTGETARAERVLIREVGAVMNTVAEAADVQGQVTFTDLMVFNFKPYIVSAWVDGVAYHAKHTGQVFLNGTPAVVHAFAQTDDLSDLVATGMNVVVRDREDGFELEWVVTLDNRSRPQRTLRADCLPLQLDLPAGLRRIEVEVDNGPDPLTAPLRPADDDLQGVACALTPGEARITVRGDLPAADRAEFTVRLNLPVEHWSLLAWPASLEVRSFDLRRDNTNTYAEFSRWIGPSLAAGDEIDVTVGTAAAPAAEPVFKDTRPGAEADTATPEPRRRGVPWLTIIAAVVLFGAYFFWRARR